MWFCGSSHTSTKVTSWWKVIDKFLRKAMIHINASNVMAFRPFLVWLKYRNTFGATSLNVWPLKTSAHHWNQKGNSLNLYTSCMSLFHRPLLPSLLLHSGLALLCIYRCTCLYITILWGGRCSEMQGQCFMLFSDLGACFHPWEKWVIVCLVAWVQMRCGQRRSVWRLQGFSLPRTYAFIWKRLAIWALLIVMIFECHRWFPFEKNGVLEVVMVKGLGILREYPKTQEWSYTETIDFNVLAFAIEEMFLYLLISKS